MTALDALVALFAPAVVFYIAGWAATIGIVFLWFVREQAGSSRGRFGESRKTDAKLAELTGR
jgi:hypothetical protein